MELQALAETCQGRVEGRIEAGGVTAFLGIPYAAPPVGPGRWRPPAAPPVRSGTLDCRNFRAIPIQQRPGPANSLFPLPSEPQDEDCLYLNVWTAALCEDERRPVIVWLQPGAYQSGAGSAPSCRGDALARAGAVVVTLNFRLSRLGFLAHPTLGAEAGTGLSGNFGLLDQIAALEWVRDNIAAFGGDPACVTLFGISSGASSASLLMASPLARGLFHRVIGESGGSFGPASEHTGVGDRWQELPAAERSGHVWAAGLGAHSVEALRALGADRLRDASRFDGHDTECAFDGVRPIIDGGVVPRTTQACFAAGGQAPVPVLLGCAADEGLATVHAPDLAHFEASVRAEFGDRADAFFALYPAADDREAVAAGLRANGHRLFTWQTWRWAHLHAATGHAVYAYRFEQAPPVPPGRYALQAPPRPLGAFHAASVFYAFGTQDSRDWPWSDDDRRLSATMIEAWVFFARTGRPLAAGLPDWPAFDPGGPLVMRLGARSQVGPHPDAAFLAFWDEHYRRLEEA